MKAIILAVLPLLGLAGGSGFAAWQIKSGSSTLSIENGPWQTAENIGSADASLQTRAVIALRGLLALPDSEAIYYNAVKDSDGQMLNGNCTYHIKGGTLAARWWSVTAYGKDNYLIPNRSGYYSAGSGAFSADQQSDWTIAVGADNVAGPGLPWIPVAKGQPFDLTLRAYHAEDSLLANRSSAALPTIERQECSA